MKQDFRCVLFQIFFLYLTIFFLGVSNSNYSIIKQKADILNITFYKDGMELENNPFRKYSTESCLAFFRDLEDGYYPTELKESYPEGVIFKV